jgi:hypothetical protein
MADSQDTLIKLTDVKKIFYTDEVESPVSTPKS